MSELLEVNVRFAGICGSDLQKINSKTTTEVEFRSLGHEAVGQFEGRWVAVNPIDGCQTCEYCVNSDEMLCSEIKALGRNMPGAFSGIILASAANIIELPDSLSPETAVLADPLAVVMHGINMIKDEPEHSLIIGDGIIAQLTAAKLLHKYPNLKSLTLTTRTGDRINALSDRLRVIGHIMRSYADIQVVQTADIGPKAIYDTTIEAVGRAQSYTLRTAIQATTNNGSIVSLGVFPPNFDAEVPIREMLYKQVKLVGSNSFQRPDFVNAVAELAENEPAYRHFIGGIFESNKWRQAVATAETKGDKAASKQIIKLGLS